VVFGLRADLPGGESAHIWQLKDLKRCSVKDYVSSGLKGVQLLVLTGRPVIPRYQMA
jgi:hypothetical protein